MQIDQISPAGQRPIEGIHFMDGKLDACMRFLQMHGLTEGVEVESRAGSVQCRMSQVWVNEFAPKCNTLSFHTHAQNLKQEILWSMLVSPHRFQYMQVEELASVVRVRENIVLAARQTALAFQTGSAERPVEFWHYEENAGFILQPGTGLIQALISATQPEITGKLYDFSCYRASEYVILLGLAQEAAQHHPVLFTALQKLNEVHAVRSGQFHEVYLHEYGSLAEPLPPQFFVPGDRLWFRNPHAASSDVTGYEGSWVIYVGGGLFSNFWKRDQPFSLVTKCVEIYHWRDGLKHNAHGEPWIDETVVEERVADTLRHPAKLEMVLSVMMKIRDPKDVYENGGCLDATRECPKQIYPSACELELPSV
jgi:hypothetical protein